MDPATALHALTTHEHSGLVMDFDGVLSPIIDDPESSELLPGTDEILESLAAKLSVVALLSGRPASFLASRASIPGVQLYGSYGIEQMTADGIEVPPEAQQWRAAVQDATRELHRELDDVEGIYVEEKSLAVAVHWRRASDQGSAQVLVARHIQNAVDSYGLRREPGKFVEELRMPMEHDKGTALQRIIDGNGLRTVAYAGDDRGDLPAFETVTAAGGYALVVDSADIAPEVSRVFGTHFDSPEAFQDWLRRLDAALR
jgi:trehalose 6-phosphate phosphatase